MAIDQTIPDSQIVGVQQHSAQDPTDSGAPGVIVPPAVLQMLMKTSTALQPKPSAAPPHPQITALTSAIAGGLQVSFKQLSSPTPYGNQITAYKIYRNTAANSFSGAQLIRTVPHDNASNQKVVQVQDLLGSNKTASYFCTSVDSTGQESTLPGSFQSASVNSGTFNPNIAQANPSTNNPTTSSTSYVTIPEMTLTVSTKGGKVLITFWIMTNSTSTTLGFFALFRDAVQLTNDFEITGALPVSITFIDSPTAASHVFTAQWKTATAQTLVGFQLARQLQVVELG